MGGNPHFFYPSCTSREGALRDIPQSGSEWDYKKKSQQIVNFCQLFYFLLTERSYLRNFFRELRLVLGLQPRLSPTTLRRQFPISSLWTSLYRGQRKSLRIHSGQDITKSRKILFETMDTLRATSQNPLKKFLLFIYQKANN